VFTSGVATNTIATARIIVSFKDRLLLLNVVENTGVAPGTNSVHASRCRFSKNGDPSAADAFYEGIPGLGGYVDAPTREAIVTAQFLKDHLVVYFESSTWELVYTRNEVLPFVWQRINSELGAESTFSQVPFDKVVLGVGNVGIHACNGINVDRVDQKIPDAVFEIHNENNGIKRVAGIRDYYTEMVYWALPGLNRSSEFPFNNRVIAYNYRTGSWSINDDSITTFGYYQSSGTTGITWQESTDTWGQSTGTWGSAPLQAKFRNVLAGNQEGFVFIVDADCMRNSPALQITDMVAVGDYVTVSCINHNLVPGFSASGLKTTGDYILIENAEGSTIVNDTIYAVDSVTDKDTLVIYEPDFTGTYSGGGVISRVSAVGITTKQYNFYVKQGFNFCVNKVDFLVDKTTDGEITVDYSVSSANLSMIEQGDLSGSITGTGVLETSPYGLIPLEASQERLWHPVYIDAEGECIQLDIYFAEAQLRTKAISVDSGFELHGLCFYASPTSSRLQ
jgi:hypothetical protein